MKSPKQLQPFAIVLSLVAFSVFPGQSFSTTSSIQPVSSETQGDESSPVARGVEQGLKGEGYIAVDSNANKSDIETAINAALGNSRPTVVDLRAINNKSISISSSSLMGGAMSGVQHNVWIVGHPTNGVKFQGSNRQILSIDSNSATSGDYNGTLSLFGLKFENGYAAGEDGRVEYHADDPDDDHDSSGNATGGGGGLGAGGAVFVNQGQVIIEQSYFNNNSAVGGNSSGMAGTGRHEKNGDSWIAGSAAGAGGRFNITSSFTVSNPGAGGGGVSIQASGGGGGNGGWGSGGGGGGGGAGSDASGKDHGGTGGSGGSGGWGAGGGGGSGGWGAGGGGAGGDDDSPGKGEPGRYGYSGDGKGPGGSGGRGGGWSTSSGDNNGDHSSGWGGGGGGAGFGGAIFVRDTNDEGNKLAAKLAIIHTEFGANNAARKGVGSKIVTSQSENADEGSERADGGSAYSAESGADGLQKGNNFFYESYYTSDTEIDEPIGSTGSNPNVNIGTNGFNPSEWPIVEIDLVGLDGEPISQVFEGERAYLRIKSSKSLGTTDRIFFFLDPKNTTAIHGENLDSVDSNIGTDFAWPDQIYYSLPGNGTNEIFINFPLSDVNHPGEDSGIVTYVDQIIEGEEKFTVQLLSGKGYRLSDNKYSKTVIIKDANYQARILASKSKLTLSDVSDALEPTSGNFDPHTEIDVSDLKGLGYATIQLERAVDEFDLAWGADGSSIPSQYEGREIDTRVYGGLFNGALGGGMPIHYTISREDEHGVQYFSNRYNYNQAGKYSSGINSDDVFHAVIVPVSETESDEFPLLPPGQARIYFSALPDAVQEDPGSYTITLEDFIDKSCDKLDPVQLCGTNTPDDDYQFYYKKPGEHEATITIHDSNEFEEKLIVVDMVTGEEVDNTTDTGHELNKLVPN